MQRDDGIDLEKWLSGFADVRESVRASVAIIRDHPLLPKDVPVHREEVYEAIHGAKPAASSIVVKATDAEVHG